MEGLHDYSGHGSRSNHLTSKAKKNQNFIWPFQYAIVAVGFVGNFKEKT